MKREKILSIKPMGDKVLLKMLPGQQGLIVAPDRYRPDVCRWEVLAVGQGKRAKNGRRLPMDLEVGEIVTLSGRFLADRHGLEVVLLSDDDTREQYMLSPEDYVICSETEEEERRCADETARDQQG